MEVDESRKRKISDLHLRNALSVPVPTVNNSEQLTLESKTDTDGDKNVGSFKLRDLLSSKRVKHDTPDGTSALDFNNVGSIFEHHQNGEMDSFNSPDNKDINLSNTVLNGSNQNQSTSNLDITSDISKESVHGQTFKSYSPNNCNNLKGNNDDTVAKKDSLSNGCSVKVKNHKDTTPSTNSTNGNIPIAYDTNISLLNLAHKLKVAEEKLARKTGKKIDNHSNCSSKMPLSSNFISHTNTNIKLQSGGIVRTSPFPSATRDKSVTGVVKGNKSLSSTVIKPIKLPNLPKPAIDVLTSLKLDEKERSDEQAPSCSNIPLWPVLGASRDGAMRMDTSFLDKYITEPTISRTENCNVTRSGRQVVEPLRLKENISDKTFEEHEEVYVPEALEKQESEAVEKIAISSVLLANLPKLAKKAYDITRLTLDASRRAVLLSVGQKQKPDAKSSNITYKETVPSMPSSDLNDKMHQGTPEFDKGINSTKVLSKSNCTASSKTEIPPKPGYTIENESNSSGEALNLSLPKEPVSQDMILIVKDINTESNTLELEIDTPIQPSKGLMNPDESGHSSKVEKELIDKKRIELEINSNMYNVMSKISIPRKYQCSQCKYQTDNRSHLRRHESSVHSGDKMYCCYVCKKEFARSEKCRAHIVKQHPGVGYDARFIRKDKFQSKQVNSSSLKGSPMLEKTEESPSPSIPLNLKTDGVLDESGLSTTSDIKETSSVDGSDLNSSRVYQNHSMVPHVESPLNLQININNDVNGVSPKTSQHDSPTRVFRCQICFYVGRDAWHLKRHISDVHNNKKAFKCKMCTYVTSRKHRLISHMKGHGELFCMHCEYSTTNYEEFQVHLKVCSLEQKAGSLTCVHCCQSFFNRKILADHMLRFHNLELFCCDLCYFTTTDPDEFEMHEQQHFKVDCSATCNKCKVSFDTEKQCEEHILHFHGGDGDDYSFNDACVDKTEDNGFKCILCGFQTEHAAVIQNHLEMHTRNMYKCEVAPCRFSAASKKAMKHHVLSEHPNVRQERKSPERKLNKLALPKVLPVDVTEEGIYDQDTGGLIGHGSGSWRCSLCPTKPPFRYRRSYEKHLSKHFTNVSSNVATAVSNVFGNLEENRETSKPENCPMCDQEFTERSKLREHLQAVHETDIVEVCNDNLDENCDPWGEEGLSRTEMWLNQQKFGVAMANDSISHSDNGYDDENNSIAREEWTNDTSKRNSEDEDNISDV